LIVGHPITAYFALAIIGTWLFQLPMILSSDGLGLIQYQVPFPIFVALFVLSAYVGPTGGAVVVTHALEGGAGVKRFFRRYVQWRVGILPYLIVLFGFPLIWLIALSSQLGLAPLQAAAAQPLAFLTSYLVGVLIFPAIIQWGEEPGWRGFALTRMQQRYSPLMAALVVGLVHGIWHLPNFLMVAGPTAAGPFSPVNFAVNTALITAVSIIFSWVFNRASQSILIAVLIHSSFNATGMWMAGLVPNIPPVAGYVVYGLYALTALIIAIVTKGRLGYRAQQGGDVVSGESRQAEMSEA
jgi:membrane protease YdiL (CAAX protease family)